ncbi:mucosal pentraxin-like [Hemiscyllium ocellatum]|uniref:mucosal pentraxin-like n=1 Tax=Hemiscyllium ocellatum TaxID=170820 RepID=UPI0029673B43|nr:mucosal pentraxin-like [Hemiscyllium ocellatum]
MGLLLGLAKLAINRSSQRVVEEVIRPNYLSLFRGYIRARVSLEKEHMVSTHTHELFRESSPKEMSQIRKSEFSNFSGCCFELEKTYESFECQISLMGFSGKSLVFQTQTDNSYVKLLPAGFSQLSAFTLCLRAASEAKRGYSLFSYATATKDNELLLWHNENTKLSLRLDTDLLDFDLPELDAQLRHICVTWDSLTGLITFWINGARSLRKVGHQGGVVAGGGMVILGQEQDQEGGGFDRQQSFVGELTDVNLWDHVLSPTDIKVLNRGCHLAGGNIINWATVEYESKGIVNIRDNKDCKHQAAYTHTESNSHSFSCAHIMCKAPEDTFSAKFTAHQFIC